MSHDGKHSQLDVDLNYPSSISQDLDFKLTPCFLCTLPSIHLAQMSSTARFRQVLPSNVRI